VTFQQANMNSPCDYTAEQYDFDASKSIGWARYVGFPKRLLEICSPEDAGSFPIFRNALIRYDDPDFEIKKGNPQLNHFSLIHREAV
jgi:hypothetical protein